MQNSKDSTPSADAANGGHRKLLTFSLGQEVYGVDILRVKEIRGWSPVTRIPQSAQSLLGVLNLRGVVVPIIDLRQRFSLAAAEFNATTVIIVLSLRAANGQREVGIVVDAVQDVVDIDAASIKPAPEVSTKASDFIAGIATHDEQMLILLDAENLVSADLTPSGSAAQAA
jgi:purine-binding chemotaxis protein CheW